MWAWNSGFLYYFRGSSWRGRKRSEGDQLPNCTGFQARELGL